MKLASVELTTVAGPVRRVCAVTDDGYVDVTAGYAAKLASEGDPSPSAIAEAVAPPDMQTFLERGDRAFDAAGEAVSFVAETDEERGPDGARLRHDSEDVRLLSPHPRPNSIRDFMVFEEHMQHSLDGDIPDVWYDIPIYYKGNPDAVVHPNEDVTWPS